MKPSFAPIGALMIIVAAITSVSTAAQAIPQDPGSPRLVLVGQSATVEAGTMFEMQIALTGGPADARVRVAVHDRVRSRSELARSSGGNGLRRTIHTRDARADQLPILQDGALALSIPLDPSATDGLTLSTPGVYPVEVSVRAGSGRSLTRVITHLVVRPPPGAAPSLAVAIVVAVGGASPRSDRAPLDAAAMASTVALLDTLTHGGHLATLAANPATLEALTAETDPEAAALIGQLQQVAARQPVLRLPYVAVSPDSLVRAQIPDLLGQELARGLAVQRAILGAEPTESAWLAAPDLAASGLTLLQSAGIDRVLLGTAGIDPPTDGLLSLARPFVLAPPRERTKATERAGQGGRTEGFVQDARLATVASDDGSPALVASRVIAELATLWFEQPAIARAAVVPVRTGADPDTARLILDGLNEPALFRPVPLDDVFTVASPLKGSDGGRAHRFLEPDGDKTIAADDASRLHDLHALRGSVRSMVGDGSSLLQPIDASLLRSLAIGLDPSERAVELDRAGAAIDAVAEAISAQDRYTITLTARSGTVPLTIHNDTGVPVDVKVRLRGSKLDLQDGPTLALTLASGLTRRDIAVRTRTSGAIPLEVEVLSPDGGLVLSATRYSVRSTAVSGVGLFLSAGAGLFLIIWWARHWRQARRSAKLVASPHPAIRDRHN